MRVNVKPFEPRVEPSSMKDLQLRLSNVRVPPLDTDSWQRGVPLSWLAALLADWKRFDPEYFQATLNRVRHVLADVDGQRVHLVYEIGRGPRPLPLLLTHGWPGSFCEYLDLLPLLVDPEGHGADAADSFTVIAPSLPGFGFSAPPPPGGLAPDRVAELWHQVMNQGLGHARYVAHGSDLGAGVTARLTRSHPDAVAAIHLATPGLGAPAKPWTPAEEAHFAEVDDWNAEEGAYAHMHATKPSTLAAALHDSPAGLAAWIGEKVVAWSSVNPDGLPAFPRDLLLTTLTLYWTTGTIATSLLPYWAHRHMAAGGLLPEGPGRTPVAISIFGGERVPFPKPPRELAERYFKVTRWEEHDRGGHFPAVAAPELLAQTLRDVFRPFR